nr:unknown [Haemonchus contortus]
MLVRLPEDVVFPNFVQEEEDELSDTDNDPPPSKWGRCVRTTANIMFSETALKFHLFTYWLFCLFGMIEEQPHSLQVIKVMLVAMAIIFALLATVTKAVCLFYPFLFVILYELSKHAIIFFLVLLKLTSPNKYAAITDTAGFNRLRKLTKATRSEDELYYIWCGFCVVYFVLVTLTILRTILDYRLRERLRRQQENVYQPPILPPVLRQRLLIPRDQEVGNLNQDDPPPYSSAIRPGSIVETAKEETDPPRYSQLELQVDRTISSQSCHSENFDETETVPFNKTKTSIRNKRS